MKNDRSKANGTSRTIQLNLAILGIISLVCFSALTALSWAIHVPEKAAATDVGSALLVKSQTNNSFRGPSIRNSQFRVSDNMGRIRFNLGDFLPADGLNNLFVIDPDVAISKNDGKDAIRTGMSTDYVVTIINHGPSKLLAGAILKDLAATGLSKTGVTCTSASGNKCVNPNGPTIAQLETAPGGYPLPELLKDDVFEFQVSATVTAVIGMVKNEATVKTAQGTNGGTDTNTVIPVADLAVNKDDGVTDVNSGDYTTYTLSLTNNGPSPADGSTIGDPIASGLGKDSILSCTPLGGAQCPDIGIGAGKLNIANLEAGTVIVPILPKNGSISIKIKVKVDAPPCGTIKNLFSASPPKDPNDPLLDTYDPDLTNNSDDDQDNVRCKDYSDAPASYGAPSHNIYTGTLRIGQYEDSETGAMDDVDALKDDSTPPLQNDDEDGVDETVNYNSNLNPQSYSITVKKLVNSTGRNATLYTWIDANKDGMFKPSELQTATVSDGTISGTAILTWTNISLFPGTFTDRIYLRIRLTTDTLLDDGSTTADDRSTAAASDGEVEDYWMHDGGIPPPGVARICKQLVANDLIPGGTIFTFSYTYKSLPVSIDVPAGTCSPILDVDSGANTFTESFRANTQVTAITAMLDQIPPTPPTDLQPVVDLPGRSAVVKIPALPSLPSTVTFTNASTNVGAIEICKQLAPGDPIPVGTLFTFSVTGAINPAQSTVTIPAGAFGSPNCSTAIIVGVGNQTVTETLRANTIVSAITVNPSDPTDSVKLEQRSITLAVPQGGVANQRVITFTNQTTRTGFLEICKEASLGDPDVTGSFNFTVEGAPGLTFSVPVGFCSAPISVTIPQVGNAPFTARVTELARPNFRLVDVITAPVNALGPIIFDAGFDANGTPLANNTNGGYVVVNLSVGGTANQKIVRFINQSLPGRIKVCKITADPVNIPINTLFTFQIAGLAGPLPGTFVNTTFDVPAGPLAQGGFCTFAPGTWVVGTPIFIGEQSISNANTTILPLGLAATKAGLKASAITATTPFVSAAAAQAAFPALITPNNPEFINPISTNLPIGGYVGTSVILARNTTAELTFTNFVYRPAVLKLCKTTTDTVLLPTGTLFTFTIAPADPTTTFPYPAAAITVPVGSCTFVNGPFPPNPDFNGPGAGVGLFNYGTNIIVTETAAPGVAVTGITSPTLTGSTPTGTLVVDLANRKGTMSLNQPLLPSFSFNELSFANGPAASAQLRTTRFDFDGDHASDIAVFRPSDGNWYYMASSNGTARAVHFGQAGDIPVAADYDGDGKTDPAVYRNGQWYVLGSTAGFSAMSFGLSSDIPQPGDFDKDGKADFAVFRPSNGTWYIMGSASGFKAVQFGTSADKPAAADFDGDGKFDPAVFRSSVGTWYILGSTSGFSGIQFGINGDTPVQADYDGDGKADVAVFRPSGGTGTWYIMLSLTQTFKAVQFGTSTDTPVPADYDADGKTDVAVYRTATNMWYILNSSQAGNAVGGFSSMKFGALGDVLLRY